MTGIVAWWARMWGAMKQYWWIVAGVVVAIGLAAWRVLGGRATPLVVVTPSSGVDVAEATQVKVDEARAVTQEQIAQIDRAEAQVQHEEQQAHETITSGTGDDVDRVLYGRKIDR